MGDAFIDTAVDLSGLRAGLQEADRLGQQFSTTFSSKLTGALTSPFTAMQSAMSTIFQGGLLGLGMRAISGIVDTLESGAKAAVDFSSSLQLQEIGWRTMLGGAQSAQVAIQAMKDLAVVSQLTYQPIEQLGRTLLGAGTNVKDLIPMLTELSDVVSAFGGSNQMFEAVGHSIERITAQQRVFARDLNALASQGIPAWKIATDAYGMSIDDMRKHMRSGSLDAQTFLDAFRKYSQQFAGTAEEASHTFTGAMNTIKDAGLFAAQTAFAPLFQVVTKLVDAIGVFMRSATFQQWAGEVNAALTVVIKTFGSLAQTVAGAAGALKGVLGGIFDPILTTVETVGNAISKGLTEALNPKAPKERGKGVAAAMYDDMQNVASAAKVASASFEDFGSAVTNAVGPAGAAVAAFQQLVSGALGQVQRAADQTNAGLAESLGAGAGKAFMTAIAAVRDMQSSLPGLQNAIDAQQSVVDGWKNKIDAAEGAIRKAESGVKDLERALRPLDDALQAARDALEAQRQKTEAARKEVENYQDQLNQAKADLAEFANAHLVGTQAFADQIFALDQQRAGVQRQLIDSQEADLQHQRAVQHAVDAQQAVVAAWEKRVNAAKDAVDRQNEAVKQAQKALDDATKAYDAQAEALKDQERQLEALSRQQQQYDDAVQAANDAVQAQKDVLDAAKQAYSDLEAQLQASQQAVKNWSQAILPGETEFQDKLFGIDQQVAAIQLKLLRLKMADQPLHASTELEKQLEAVNAQVEASVKSIQKLREQGSPTDAVEQANQQYADLILKQHAIYDKIQAERQQQGNQPASPEVDTLTQQLQALQDQAEQTRLEQTLQIDPLRRQLEQLADTGKKVGDSLSFEDIRQHLIDAKQSVEDLTKALTPQQEIVAREQAALDKDNAALKQATRVRDDFKNAIKRQQDALKDQESALAYAREQGLKPYQAAVAQAKDRLDSLQATLQGQQKGLDAQRERLAEIRDHLGETSDRTKDLTEQLRLLDQRAEQTKLDEQLQLGPAQHELEKLRDTAKEMTFEQIRDGMQKAQQRVNGLEAALKGAQARLDDQTKAQDAAQAAVDRASKAVDAQRRQIELANHAIEDMRTAVDPLNESLQTQEKRLQALQKEYAETKKRVDEYTAALRQALQVAADQEKDKGAGGGGQTPGGGGTDFTQTPWYKAALQAYKNVTETTKQTIASVQQTFDAITARARALPNNIAAFFADPEWGKKLGTNLYNSLWQITINVTEWWDKNKDALGKQASKLADGIGDWLASPDGARAFAKNLGVTANYFGQWLTDSAKVVGGEAWHIISAIDDYMRSADGQRRINDAVSGIYDSIKGFFVAAFASDPGKGIDDPVNSAFIAWLKRVLGVPPSFNAWLYDDVYMPLWRFFEGLYRLFGLLDPQTEAAFEQMRKTMREKLGLADQDINGPHGTVLTMTGAMISHFNELDTNLNGERGVIPALTANTVGHFTLQHKTLTAPITGAVPRTTLGIKHTWGDLDTDLNGQNGVLGTLTQNIWQKWKDTDSNLVSQDRGIIPKTNLSIWQSWNKLGLQLTNDNDGTVYGAVHGIWDLFKWLYKVLVGNSTVPETTGEIAHHFGVLKKNLTGDKGGDPQEGTILGDLVITGKLLFEHWKTKTTATVRRFLGIDKDNDSILAHFEHFIGWLVGGTTAKAMDAASALGGMVTLALGIFESWKAGAIQKVTGLVGDYTRDFDGVLGWVGYAVRWIEGQSQDLANRLLSPFTKFAAGIPGVMTGVVNALIGTQDGKHGGINAAIIKLTGFLQSFANAINWISNTLRLGDIIGKVPDGKDWTLPQLARGTPSWQGGWAEVGERGQEVAILPHGAAYLPPGTQVIPHDRSVAALRAGLLGIGPADTPAPTDPAPGTDNPLAGAPWIVNELLGSPVLSWMGYGARWMLSHGFTMTTGKALDDFLPHPTANASVMDKLVDAGVGAMTDSAVKAVQSIFDKVWSLVKDWVGGGEAGPSSGLAEAEQIMGLTGARLTNTFNTPSADGRGIHGGIDLAAPQGTPVGALLSGRVTLSEWSDDYGNRIIVQADNGWRYYYGHLLWREQGVGTHVDQRQRVGGIGGAILPDGTHTGGKYAFGSHLHLGIWNPQGTLVDPLAALPLIFPEAQVPEAAGGPGGFWQSTTGAAKGWIRNALTMGGWPDDWSLATSIIAWFESNDDPRAINLHDSNFPAHPSRGLMQTIPDTFNRWKRAMAQPYTGNQGWNGGDLGDPGDIYDPIENIIAAINYILRGKGLRSPADLPGVQNVLHGGGYVGYATGGRLDEEVWGLGLKSGTVYSFAEGNKPEWIIPEMPASRVPQEFGGGVQVVVVEKGDTHHHFDPQIQASYATVQPERSIRHDLRLMQMLYNQTGRGG